MRLVYTFIKYSEKLLADNGKLSQLEKSLIIRDTNPDVIHKFSEEEEMFQQS